MRLPGNCPFLTRVADHWRVQPIPGITGIIPVPVTVERASIATAVLRRYEKEEYISGYDFTERFDPNQSRATSGAEL